MNQSAMQIILSTIVILNNLFLVWWTAVYDTSSNLVRIISVLLSGLGLAVLLTETLWKKRETRNRLAVIHIVAGVSIIVFSVLIGMWASGLTLSEKGAQVDAGLAGIAIIICGILGLGISVVSILRLARFKKEIEESTEKAKMPYDVLSLRRG